MEEKTYEIKEYLERFKQGGEHLKCPKCGNLLISSITFVDLVKIKGNLFYHCKKCDNQYRVIIKIIEFKDYKKSNGSD